MLYFYLVLIRMIIVCLVVNLKLLLYRCENLEEFFGAPCAAASSVRPGEIVMFEQYCHRFFYIYTYTNTDTETDIVTVGDVRSSG